MTTLIGIDPGVTGGIAWMTEGVSHASKMPETEKDVYELLKTISMDSKCLLEKVHSMPRMGVVQMFSFGRNYGFLRGCLISLGISFDEVRPQEWQKSLGCLTRGDKNISKAKAAQLYPEKKVIHATADSLLILEYLRRRELGKV